MNESLLFHKATSKILLIMNETEKSGRKVFSCQIARKTGITFSHIVKVIKEFEAQGLLEKKAEGRTILLTLTEKGKAVAEKLKSIYKIMEIEDERN